MLLLQAAEFAAAVKRFGEFFCRQSGDADVVRAVCLDIPLCRLYRGFGNFGGQNPAEAAGERQGEVAVAAIEFEQVAVWRLGAIACPFQHFFAYCGIRLGEAAFRLAVAEGFAVYRQCFGNEILRQHQFLPLAAADDEYAEFFLQGKGGVFPAVVEFAVVNQADQHFAAQGAEEFALVEAVFQQRVGGQFGQ